MTNRYVLAILILCAACLIAARPAFAATAMVSAGGGHTVALKSDGTVVAWGNDNSGQAGNGRLLFAPQPVLLAGLPAIKSVSAGLAFGLALASDGSLWAWGDNTSGQLGDGTRVSNATPHKISGLGTVVQAAAGQAYGVALLGDGTVWSWGSNAFGQMGDGTFADRLRPVQVQGLAPVAAIAAGAAHTLAFFTDGRVFGWGSNSNVQIVPNSQDRFTTPTQVGGLPTFTAIAAAGRTSFALTPDGSVYWWGQMEKAYPPGAQGAVRIVPFGSSPPLAGIVKIGASATADFHALFVDGSGQLTPLRSIADATADPNGNLLGAQTVLVNTFTPMTNLAPVAAAATGGDEILTPLLQGTSPQGTFSVLVMQDGSVMAWGKNNCGQVGDGSGTDQAAPVAVPGIAGAVGVATGQAFALVVTSGGQVYAWGDNSSSQLGVANSTTQSVPGRVTGLSNVKAVSAGGTHSLALAADGTIWAWGDSLSAQLGDGSTVSARSTAAQIPLFSGVAAVAAGGQHSLALINDGHVWSWGGNGSGELGRHTSTLGPLGNTISNTPGQVQGIANATAIAAGAGYSIALLQDGTVWVWGTDPLSPVADATVPRKVAGLAGIVAIAAGAAHHLALAANGTVWAWGANAMGQVGNGRIAAGVGIDQPTPVTVPLLPNISAIAAGGNQSLALAGDGSLWAWGTYTDPLVSGGEAASPVFTPVMIQPAATATAMTAGTYHSVFISSAGLTLSSGLNQWGQIGDGGLVIRHAPVVVVREAAAGSVATSDWFLDLNPANPKSVASTLVPRMIAVASEAGTDVAKTIYATMQVLPKDAGAAGSVFLTAMIPDSGLSALNGGPSGTAAASTNYIMVQLTPSGWQTVADLQLLPLQSGTLGNSLATQTVIGGVDTTQIPGAQFCLGYGANAQSMAANGTIISVLGVGGAPPGAKINCVPASASVIPQSGLWWNPAEGGRGFTIEQVGGRIFMAAYLYDASGRSTWYGAGPAAMDGSTFNAPMTSYSGGQTLTGAWRAPVQGASPGNLSMTFTDPTHGTLTWPGGTIPITRYEFTPGGLGAPPSATQPQTGWWWNPDEGGRGFSIEVQNSQAFIATYMYDGNGNPVWYAAPVGPLPGNIYQGNWTSYSGGQTLTGSYRSPAAPVFAGFLTVQFISATSASLTLPDGRVIALQRFPF